LALNEWYSDISTADEKMMAYEEFKQISRSDDVSCHNYCGSLNANRLPQWFNSMEKEMFSRRAERGSQRHERDKKVASARRGLKRLWV
jgi:hypothetical protein